MKHLPYAALIIMLSFSTLSAQNDITKQLKDIQKEQKSFIEKAALSILSQQESINLNLAMFTELSAQQDTQPSTIQNGLIDRLTALETKFKTLEKKQGLLEQNQEAYEKIEEIRQETETKLLRLSYLASIDIINFISEKTKGLKAIYAWGDVVSGMSSLSNPRDFDDFDNTLTTLKNNQKNQVRLPDFQMTNPILNTAYSFVSGIFNKKDDKGKADMEKLNCILEFTLQAEKQLGFIELEGAHLHALAEKTNNEVSEVRFKVFNLVGLDTSKTIVHAAEKEKVSLKLKDSTFLAQNREQIGELMQQVVEIHQEYEVIVSLSIGSVEKTQLALDKIKSTCQNNKNIDNIIKAKKAALVQKIIEAKDSLKEALDGDLEIYRIVNPVLPSTPKL